MATEPQSQSSTTEKDLKLIKTKMRFKTTDVRQCRLCLRMLPQGEVRLTNEDDFRRKVSDAVGVKITDDDKVPGVCANCLLLVDMVLNFRETCRKADTIHQKRLLVIHPGNWTSEESKTTLEKCHSLVERNWSRMEGLFKHFEAKDEQSQRKVYQNKGTSKRTTLIDNEALERLMDSVDRLPSYSTLFSDEDDNDQEFRVPFGIQVPDETPPPPEPKPSKPKPRLAKKVMCDECGKFVETGNLSDHRNRHLGVRPYACEEPGCESRFFGYKTLQHHVEMVHCRTMVECKICHRKVKGECALERHMETHDKIENNSRRVPCRICGKRFYKTYLKDHMAVHTGLLAYPCGLCDRRFAALNNRIIHWKNVHPGEERP